jgi:hypothetical protein
METGHEIKLRIHNQYGFQAILVWGRHGTSSRIIQGAARRYGHSRVQTRKKTDYFSPLLYLSIMSVELPANKRNGYNGYISDSSKKVIQRYKLRFADSGYTLIGTNITFLVIAGVEVPLNSHCAILGLPFAQASGLRCLSTHTPNDRRRIIVQWEVSNADYANGSKAEASLTDISDFSSIAMQNEKIL